MMTDEKKIERIFHTFVRHDRNYCIFSIAGSDADYLYYSHVSQPLRSLMFGHGFLMKLPGLLEKEDLCIECGMGLSIAGGVALDDGELLAWNTTIDEAASILAALKQAMGDAGNWIEPF